MEKGLKEMLSYLKESFGISEIDLKTYSPLTLAYIGDGVYELVIRTLLVGQGNCQVQKLHQRASMLVKAGTQAAMAEALKEVLTEEEQQVFRRGRNAHSGTMAKHATMADYRRATGFEALIGFLYLKEDWERIVDLVKQGLLKTGNLPDSGRDTLSEQEET